MAEKAQINITDLGTVEYGKAWDVQREYFDRLMADRNTEKAENTLLYCEHPHVYTLGKSGHENNLLISEEFLGKIGATVFKTDRGGDITYHGYGQLVGYPIIDLQQFGLGLKEYIHTLEECIIATIREFGIEGYRVPSATGVWVRTPGGEKKICAIGVKASRFITMHGFALNVNTDLTYFSHINPCGFTTKGVTSIKEMCGEETDMERVKEIFSGHFASLFGCDIK